MKKCEEVKDEIGENGKGLQAVQYKAIITQVIGKTIHLITGKHMFGSLNAQKYGSFQVSEIVQ